MGKGGFIYIMTNRYRNVLYIGVTSNLPRRIHQHRHHFYKKSFSDRYNVEYLIYYEIYGSIVSAIAREKQVKRWSREKKEALVATKNPEKRDLYDEVMSGSFSLLSK